MIGTNTNQSANFALHSLNDTNRSIAQTQDGISIGLKVASARDNGGIWASAGKMRSGVSGYERVTGSADMAAAQVDTGIATGESMMDLLNQMKGMAWLAARQAYPHRHNRRSMATLCNRATNSPA